MRRGYTEHAPVSCRRTSERSASPWSDCRERAVRLGQRESCGGASTVITYGSYDVHTWSIQTAQRLRTAGPGLTEAE